MLLVAQESGCRSRERGGPELIHILVVVFFERRAGMNNEKLFHIYLSSSRLVQSFLPHGLEHSETYQMRLGNGKGIIVLGGVAFLCTDVFSIKQQNGTYTYTCFGAL